MADLQMHCRYCDEPILPDEPRELRGRDWLHYECEARLLLGSVGHQRRTCSCYGGAEEDPPGMTRREAAQAALALWRQEH